MDQAAPTQFAPAERAHSDQLRTEWEYLESELGRDPILDAISEIVAILNDHRQIVFCNRRLLELLKITLEDVLGKRPGEVLDCVHADETPGGCGTTEFCRECGAANAILSAQQGTQALRECRVLTKDGGALDLRVWATPLVTAAHEFTVFSATDIRHEKRREALEKTFFHDILNTAGTVFGAAELLLDDDLEDPKPFLEAVSKGSEQLVDEIRSHRMLLAAEEGTLQLDWRPVHPLDALEAVKNRYSASSLVPGPAIEIEPGSPSLEIETDPILLARILGNLVKNAMEATEPGGTVTLSCRGDQKRVVFSVRNPAVMEDSVRRQVFQRSFSTKGPGRGLGTFSVKLFGEQYLGGRVWFESAEPDGTAFHVELPVGPGAAAAGGSEG